MRLAEDDSSWRASGIKCRDFRHTHGDPEVDTTSKARPKKRKPRPCKHVWVEVTYHEYSRYAKCWWYLDEIPHWAQHTVFSVCAECLATKRKIDRGRERVYYRRQAEKRRKAWARAS